MFLYSPAILVSLYIALFIQTSLLPSRNGVWWNGVWCIISNDNVLMTTVMIFFPGGHSREEIQKQQAGLSPINLDFCFKCKGHFQRVGKLVKLQTAQWWWTDCLLAGIWMSWITLLFSLCWGSFGWEKSWDASDSLYVFEHVGYSQGGRRAPGLGLW